MEDLNLENKQVCFWLGTMLEPEQIPEAEGFLNEVLDITSCDILFFNLKNQKTGLHFVAFTIDNSDVPRASITRLKTDDIKWNLDYPDYDDIFIQKLRRLSDGN